MNLIKNLKSCFQGKSSEDKANRENKKVELQALLDSAIEYEHAGNLEEAYAKYLTAAEAGLSEAMYRLFVLFVGKGFHAKEENNLFELALKGSPILPWSIKAHLSPDMKTGIYWLSRAADSGHIDACNIYGRMLCDADDIENGLSYLHKSADAGNSDATRWISYFTKHDPVSDEEYDVLLAEFFKDNNINVQSAGILKDGRPDQLARYGYKLMLLFNQGLISSGDLNYYMPKSNGIPYHPVAPKRGNWETFVRVNKNALPDGTLLTFTSDINTSPKSLHGLKFVGEVVYRSPSFGWLKEEKTACVMEIDSSVDLDEETIKDVASRYYLRNYEYRTEDVAFFEEDGEKEYSVEIAEIRDGKVNVLYRYTIDGSDQVDSYFEPELIALKLND